MGCCISRFTHDTKKFRQEEEDEAYSYAQDKLVVSHYQSKASPIPIPIPEKKQFFPTPDKVIHIHIPGKFTPPPPPSKVSPLSPTQTSTTSSISVSSSSLSLSTASSVSVSKERSFSNEFLQSCYRDNPHVVRINSLREASVSLKTLKPATPSRSNSPVRAKRYPSTPNRSNTYSEKGSEGTPLQNRFRANSPNRRPVTWKNNIREDQERVISSSATSMKSSRFLKSPSPSRRFGMAGSRVSPVVRSVSSSERLESLDLRGSMANLRNRAESRIHRIGSKIDGNVVKEVITNQNEAMALPEDIDNPLIALDCFIFL